MATLNTFTAVPTTVPPGGSADVQVTFSTQAGGVVTLELLQDGVSRGTREVTFDPEPAPVVQANGMANVGWELRATAGTLVALGDNAFRLTL